MPGHVSAVVGSLALGVISACGRLGFDALGPLGSPGTIGWRSTSTSTIPMTGGVGVTLDLPTGTAENDLLVAVLAMGNTGAPKMPDFVAPVGWTFIRRDDQANDTTLAVYWLAATASEPANYKWTFSQSSEGIAWISAYTGVDIADPIDAEDGQVLDDAGPAYPTPSLATTVPNTLVVAAYAAHDGGSSTEGPAIWTAPAGAVQRVALDNGSTRTGTGVDLAMPTSGSTGEIAASVLPAQDYGLASVLALRPSP